MYHDGSEFSTTMVDWRGAAVLPDIHRRIVNAKYIFERATSIQAENAEMSLSIALLLAHDAIELLMLAMLDHVGAKPNTRRNFMEFWADMKQATGQQPPDLIPMEALNKLRVGLKHNGNLPHAQTVKDLIPRCKGFFENVLNAYCQLRYDDVSLIDMLPDAEVISLLKKAEEAFIAGERFEAMLNLKFAFHRIERPDGKILPFLEAPKKPSVPYELRQTDLDQYLVQLHSFLNECAKSTNAILLKIDRLQYDAYLRVGPYIQWTMDGRPHVHCSDTFESLSREDFDKWTAFVIDYAFKAADVYIPNVSDRYWDGAPREYFVRPTATEEPLQS
jgi:hypothetical protein